MRPQILFPLFAPVTALPGVGPRIARLVDTAAGPQVVDLLWHLPTALIDRRHAPKVGAAQPGEVATLTVEVDKHVPPAGRKQPYRVRCRDETGFLTLVFFHAKGEYLAKILPEGRRRVVSGTVDEFGGEKQMAHPDHIGTTEELEELMTVEPVYRLTAGLSLKVLGKAIRAALDRAPELPEWIEPSLISRQGWPAWRDALLAAHAPESEAELDPAAPARARLAYDELLANQLALFLVRARQRKRLGRSLVGDGTLTAKVVAALPFALTGAQERAVEEIVSDMAAPERMMRLLQGDVGSGKTVVAMLAMATAVEAGTQAALMAPTEILARQHFATIEPLASAAGLRTALLTGRDKGAARKQVLSGLADGTIRITVGTHALFQEEVAFKDLGLAVVDEQHRFGVHQRMTLGSKGKAADMLVMTATPIPRTLMMAAYGDLDASQLTEKPTGRQPIDTRTVAMDRLDEVIGAARRAVEGGAKVFWVCPLVEESENSDLSAAEERHRQLKGVFGDRVGLVHGRMKGTEKDAVMAAFTDGSVDVLVATTVIEVGVDVPAATVMVIERAERFGLAQLHQLRGRIGRGDKRSTCLLLYAAPLSETARARLQILRETEDGFRIAEEDLRLRGAGEMLGTRQSGLPEFRLVDLAAHADLMAVARDDARLTLERDPELESDRGRALRTLLYLFERDAAVRYLRA